MAKFKINTTQEKAYHQYLTFLNVFYNLTKTEIKLISAALEVYKTTEGAHPEIRWGYVFSSEGRVKMRKATGLAANAFNVCIYKLKSKEIRPGVTALEENDYLKITDYLLIDPLEDNQIVVEFNIQEDGREEATRPAGQPTKEEKIEEEEKVSPIQKLPPTGNEHYEESEEVVESKTTRDSDELSAEERYSYRNIPGYVGQPVQIYTPDVEE